MPDQKLTALAAIATPVANDVLYVVASGTMTSNKMLVSQLAGSFGLDAVPPTAISLGVNPAQSGAVRLANNQSVSARNAANTADRSLLALEDPYVALGNSGSPAWLKSPSMIISGYLDFGEMTAPAAPGANRALLYCEDNGAGKTRVMVRFATGAAVQLAIEP